MTSLRGKELRTDSPVIPPDSVLFMVRPNMASVSCSPLRPGCGCSSPSSLVSGRGYFSNYLKFGNDLSLECVDFPSLWEKHDCQSRELGRLSPERIVRANTNK